MVPPSSFSELQSAWRALAGAEERAGWRTIKVGSGRRPICAGRHSPDNAEAVLFGFRNVSVPVWDELPNGRGFRVAPVDLGAASDGGSWIALSREDGANTDLFMILANDVMAVMSDTDLGSEQNAFRVFLQRINAWQSFMQRQIHQILSEEAETGLAGELLMLTLLVDAGAAAATAVDAWQGPLDGLQDFIFRRGAVEVKASITSATFPATISSLEQLDDTLVHPLFIAAIRLMLAADGSTLPEIAAKAREAVGTDPTVLTTFDARLIHAGLLPSHGTAYTRRFVHTQTRLFRVSGSIPRITRATVASAIRKARYELDLDLINAPSVDLPTVISLLEVG